MLVRAEEYAQEALDWLLEDGVAQAVTVRAWVVRTGVLGLEIDITRPGGVPMVSRYEMNWEGQNHAIRPS